MVLCPFPLLPGEQRRLSHSRVLTLAVPVAALWPVQVRSAVGSLEAKFPPFCVSLFPFLKNEFQKVFSNLCKWLTSVLTPLEICPCSLCRWPTTLKSCRGSRSCLVSVTLC